LKLEPGEYQATALATPAFVFKKLIVAQVAKKFLFFFQNPKIRYSFHKRPELDPILIQMNPDTLLLYKILFNIILPSSSRSPK
jgi:hypothetical protein